MGNHDHMLNKYQFRSAKEEGKEASDWLSTEEGHEWQDREFKHPNPGTGWHGNNPLHLAASDERLYNNWQHHGLFSYKEESGGESATWPEPPRHQDLEYHR